MELIGDTTTVMETSSGEAVAAHDGGEVIMMDANSGEEENNNKGKEGEEEEEEEGDNKINSNNNSLCGGNRWPRQETLALLKIRSDMDAVFRDSSLKGPLWEEVARKLSELGYHRSAKKCKEKFENVYKYHKRTKESRSGKHEGKTYKFFDQLQALENQFTVSYSPKPQPTLATTTNIITLPPPTRPSDTTAISYVTTTVPSTNPTIISPSPQPPTHATTTTTITSPTVATNPKNPPQSNNNSNIPNYSLLNMNNLFSTTSTSSSTASDEDLEEKYRKKRKWKDYFRRLTRQVLAKQEEMQKRFLEAIDNREREQVAQQEAWRIQEMARINREHELLVQERSTAAAKNAAVIAFLQQLSGQHQNSTTTKAGANFLQQPLPQQVQPPRQQAPQPLMMSNNNNIEIQKMNNGHSVVAAATPTTVVAATAIATTAVTTTPSSLSSLSSSRWPKTEVHALIRLRTSLEAKYQENGPKAPFWEDISAGMLRLGYNRSAKRCKEKWENINKYFKKVKESNKQRREDSKTCPYFHELEALYKEKSKTTQNPFGASFHNMKPHEMMEPLMVQPEQQWRPPTQYEQGAAKENNNSERKEREEEEEEEDDDENEEGDLESVEDEGGNRYEIATNKLSSVDTVE
ncbi:trihelix transcription factor GT-2-like [Glycine soja]|uniref:Trihelix transcription factor GT-2 n=1 Tax=Glycine soja TaxID=3848 RepID=A0A445F652_GLYSO|nr:trihelix transcription factor GT-2-like [Glycine soja]RZB44276.1 Trihelix transcription factor GT-2 [Glycine soja]